LQAYLRYTREHEAPELYHLWVGISIIAAALGRRVWVGEEDKYYRVYPNHYIMLIGESGNKKSSAADYAPLFLREIENRPLVLQDALSRKYLLRTLQKDYEARGLPPSAYIHAAEASTAIGPLADYTGLIQDLVRLHDCPIVFEYGTTTAGEYAIPEPCINILMASVPEWIGKGMTSDKILGGFAARFALVYQDRTNRCNPMGKMPVEAVELKNSLVADLKGIAALTGPFERTKEMVEYWEGWYRAKRLAELEKSDPKLRPYYARKHVATLKLCQVLSVAQDDELSIDENVLTQSLELLTKTEIHMKYALREVAPSDYGRHHARVQGQIEAAGEDGLDHTHLLTKNSMFIKASEVKEIVANLIEEGAIEVFEVSSKSRRKKRIYKARTEGEI